MSTTKVVYTKEDLLQLREAAEALTPSDELLSAVRTIEETSEPAPVKPASRFERRQEKQKQPPAAAPAPAARSTAASMYDKFSRAGPDRGDRNVPASTWRGGKDRETFEEGYLYELRESAKQRKTLESTIAEQDILLGKAAVSKEAVERTEKAVAETKSAKESEEDAKQDDDGFFQALTQKPRTSRFFSGGGADDKDEPSTAVPRRTTAAAAINPVDIELPSSTVVWNHNAAVSSQQNVKAQQSTSAGASSTAQPSSRPAQQRQPALPTAAPPNAKVISAADLENQLFGRQKVAEAPPSRPTTAVMGTFDAAQLEQQLLAKTLQQQPKVAPAPTAPVQAASFQQVPTQPPTQQQQHQPLPLPQAPFQVQPSVRVQYPAQVQIQGGRPAAPMAHQVGQWGVQQQQIPAQQQILLQPQHQYGYYPATAGGTFQQQPNTQQPMMMYPQQPQQQQRMQPAPQQQPFGLQGAPMQFVPSRQ